MSQTIVDLTCPGCGARVSSGQAECKYCHQPVVISTFNSVYTMSAPEINKYASSYKNALAQDPDNQQINAAIAMCYLKLNLYDKALTAFEKAMEDNFDNAEVFFYAAICMLQGKKAFLAQRCDINKIEEYINAATMIEPKGIYNYFHAYIKYDYFERKQYNTSPNYREYLNQALQQGISEYDVTQLFSILKVQRPQEL